MNTKLFEDYLKDLYAIWKSGEEREHSYRTPFHQLVRDLVPHDIQIIQEPHMDKDGKGAPDFVLKKDGCVIGYIETKKIGENLFRVEKSPQIAKYTELSNNLIITDYVNFLWVRRDEGVVERIQLVHPSVFEYATPRPEQGTPEQIAKLFEKFAGHRPEKIGTANQLADALAKRSRYLKEFLDEELAAEAKDQNNRGHLYALYETFRDNLNSELTLSDFADTFAQVVAYSLFLAKLNAPEGEKLDLINVQKYISSSFQLIQELVKFLDLLNNERRFGSIKWLLEQILSIINNMDSFSIAQSLSFSRNKSETADPYIYFYEDFLTQYDKASKVDRGVFYTPPEAVKYIVESVDAVLKNDLGVQAGLSDTNVTLLDFACGTGTFMLEVIREILENLPQGSAGLKNKIIEEHILKNIYGFEYLIAPYAVAHLKLSQYLKEQGYEMKSGERLQIYMTNTLGKLDPQHNAFMPSLSEEGRQAHHIKEQQKIQVIVGNPPYNVHSQNPSAIRGELTHIGKLVEAYKPEDEKKLNIDDDYIKFIRFAHHKLEHVDKGVIGVITNNSYLNGLTHRRMRNELLKDFAKIYVLNLHGNSNIGETTPDGEKDENIFAIRQGVGIAIFVKNKGE